MCSCIVAKVLCRVHLYGRGVSRAQFWASADAASTSVRGEEERATCVLFNKQPRQPKEFLEAQRLDGSGVFCCFYFIPGGEKFYPRGQFYHPQVLTALPGMDGIFWQVTTL